jgi:hypothetical protein
MANVVTLHKRQLFLPDGTVARFGRINFCLNHTTTQLQVYSDPSCAAEFERSQPVICDVFGVMPVCYMVAVTAYRILATDENDVPLPGYPMDDITPEPTDASGANTTSFSPTAEVPRTDVQSAIEYVAGLIPETDTTGTRVWTTGGTGNAYTLTPTPALEAYAAGVSYWIRPDRANTGAVTINISGLGTRSVQKTNDAGTPVAFGVGEFAPYREVLIADDGSVFRVLSRRDDAFSGSDANGRFDRFSNGLQICTGTLSLPFNGPSNCAGTWTFPGGPFILAALGATCQIVGGPSALDPATSAASATAIPIQDLGTPLIGPRTSVAMTVRVYRASAVNFGTSDILYSVVSAIGRWK